MTHRILLKNWSVTYHHKVGVDPYVGICLQGNVYGHPGFTDGSFVITGEVKQVCGREAMTSSGTHYILSGEADPKYMQFLEKIGCKLDVNNPIKQIKYDLN